jgi:heme A synthase
VTTLRRLSYAALGAAFLHVVFGAIVRISGSGMGCGDHWPKCYGYWFPPFERPDLVIEVLHRYFAATLITVVLALLGVALLRRREPGVAGRGGVLRAAALASGLVTFAAAFGAVTVRFANAPWATVTHKGIAAALLAALAAAAVRSGGFGGARAVAAPVATRTARAAYVAAALAIVAVLLGGLTAKVAAGAVACRGFPLCGEGSLGGGAQHVQLTHRLVAYLLAFHLVGLAIAVTRRRERGPVATAARVGAGVVVVQIALGAAMVLAGFYPVLRSAHQATGITLWLTAFLMAYLARRGAQPGGEPATPHLPTPPVRPRSSPTPAAGPARVLGLGRAESRPAARDAVGGAAPRARAALPAARELALAAGGDGGWRGAHPGGRPTPPAPMPLVRGPELVVQSQPLRRGRHPAGRRGRDAASRPFGVVDGRVRPAAALLAPPAPRHRVMFPAALAALPLLTGAHDALAFDLAHAGPEFTIVVWSAAPPARVVDEVVSTPSAGTEGERATHGQAMRRFAGLFSAAAAAEEAVVEVAIEAHSSAAPAVELAPSPDTGVESIAPAAPVERASEPVAAAGAHVAEPEYEVVDYRALDAADAAPPAPASEPGDAGAVLAPAEVVRASAGIAPAVAEVVAVDAVAGRG